MDRLIAIDPGQVSGFAFFRDGKLADCGTWKGGKPGRRSPPASANVVIECPQAAWRSTAEDIIKLARIVGRFEQWADGLPCRIVSPATWKGSVPKTIHHNRIRDVLTYEEIQILPTDPNAIDACGLGLWALRRIRR